jgi:hypothetical protein
MNDRTVCIEATSKGYLAGNVPEGAIVPVREPVDLRLETLKAWLTPCDEIDRVVFTGPGEPLLHPRIAYLVRTARQYGASCAIETGARVLEGRLVRDLIEAGLDELWVRLDAPSREGYQARRLDDGFGQVLVNLAALADERNMLLARNPDVRVLLLPGVRGSLPPRQVERLRVTVGVASRLRGPYVSVTGEVFAWGPAPDARDLADLPRLGAVADRPLTEWEIPEPPAPPVPPAPPAPSDVEGSDVAGPTDLPPEPTVEASEAPTPDATTSPSEPAQTNVEEPPA